MEKISIWDILFWIIIIVLLIMILTRMFGSSATDIQIYLGFISSMIIIVGYILKLASSQNNLNVEIINLKNSVTNSFSKVKLDIYNVNRNINEISKNIRRINNKLSIK